MTSPPSGCQRDFHPRAVEHARHTQKSSALSSGALAKKSVYLLATGTFASVPVGIVATFALGGAAPFVGAAAGALAAYLLESGRGHELDLPKGAKLELELGRALYLLKE